MAKKAAMRKRHRRAHTFRTPVTTKVKNPYKDSVLHIYVDSVPASHENVDTPTVVYSVHIRVRGHTCTFT